MAANLPLVWESWNYHQKQNFQNILFPEGLLYDAKQEHYRIEKINCVFGHVAHCSQELLKIKSRFPLKLSEKNGFVPGGSGLSNLLEGFEGLRILMNSRSWKSLL